KRRGEAIELLMNDMPTYGYFPYVYYYQGRVRQALKTSAFADSFRTYLSVRRQSAEEPLLPEVRKSLGQKEPKNTGTKAEPQFDSTDKSFRATRFNRKEKCPATF